MRGKPVAKQLRHRRVGITPADAGKTRQNGKSASSPGITPADAGKTDDEMVELHNR